MVLLTSQIPIEKLQLANRKILPIVKFTISHEPGAYSYRVDLVTLYIISFRIVNANSDYLIFQN